MIVGAFIQSCILDNEYKYETWQSFHDPMGLGRDESLILDHSHSLYSSLAKSFGLFGKNLGTFNFSKTRGFDKTFGTKCHNGTTAHSTYIWSSRQGF